jgi:hypothetical protein
MFTQGGVDPRVNANLPVRGCILATLCHIIGRRQYAMRDRQTFPISCRDAKQLALENLGLSLGLVLTVQPKMSSASE